MSTSASAGDGNPSVTDEFNLYSCSTQKKEYDRVLRSRLQKWENKIGAPRRKRSWLALPSNYILRECLQFIQGRKYSGTSGDTDGKGVCIYRILFHAGVDDESLVRFEVLGSDIETLLRAPR
jgi:hypothetical protein